MIIKATVLATVEYDFENLNDIDRIKEMFEKTSLSLESVIEEYIKNYGLNIDLDNWNEIFVEKIIEVENAEF